VFIIPLFCCGVTLLTYLVFPPPHTDILVLGVDGRGNEGFNSRTDSIMLVGIDPRTLYVSVLSLPRDLFIEAPGYGSQRINTLNALGEQTEKGRGPLLLSAAIQQTFAVGVERSIRLDFAGFVKMVDAVGGVTIDVERTIVDDMYPTDEGGVTTVRFDSGVQQMDGERALIYARTRHADDDYYRAARQQQVLSALLRRLVNPARWPGVLQVINQSVDTNLTLWDMLTLAPPVLLNAGRYDQLVLNREYIVGSAQGGHAVPDLERLTPWLQPRFN
jgi:LCP family protein required for cell wall assembly